jgi:nucleotidyltransferase substrate binding protein (TIGR01987 family)
MKLDVSSLKKALASLEKAVARASASPADLEVRDAVIQRFEYSYDLCWKMMKRRIEMDAPNPAEIDRLSYRDLLREAAERNLIENVSAWILFRDQRNITSHTYDESKAAQVYQTAVEFLPQGRLLLGRIEGVA